MKADFAYWFFSQIFEAQFFINQDISWGVDLMWCGAAYQYNIAHGNTSINACSLIPLNILDRDTKQISKADGFHDRGSKLVNSWQYDPRFASWFSQANVTLRPKIYTARSIRKICEQLDRNVSDMSKCARVIHAEIVKHQESASNVENGLRTAVQHYLVSPFVTLLQKVGITKSSKGTVHSFGSE
jgi:hypothetical protein